MSAPHRGRGQPHPQCDAQDPSRILEYVRIERRNCFRRLVRLYLSQILYGCKSAYCDTPTCLSCSKRTSSKPFRPPTQLTARTLAHYLASQGNPHAGLCPHELKVAPESFEIEGLVDEYTGARQDSADIENISQLWWRLARQSREKYRVLDQSETVFEKLAQQHQKKKDPKSLVQNLYDSATIVSSYSKRAPTKDAVLPTFCSEQHHKEILLHTTQSSSQIMKESADAATLANEKMNVTTTTGLDPHTHHQKSSKDYNEPIQLNPDVLSSGHQVHKIPYHLPNKPTKDRKGCLTEASLSTATNQPRLSVTKTGKKNFTIGKEYIVSGEQKTTLEKDSNGIPSDGESSSKSKTPTPGIPMIPTLDCDMLNALKKLVQAVQTKTSTRSEYHKARRHHRDRQSFVDQVLFYNLSNADTLTDSFYCPAEKFKDSPLPHLDSNALIDAFSGWKSQSKAQIFDSLCIAAEALFTPPPELTSQKSPRLKPSSKTTSRRNSVVDEAFGLPSATSHTQYLSNLEAAHLSMICIHALTSSVREVCYTDWINVRKARSQGEIIPNSKRDFYIGSSFIDLVDDLEYEPAVRLADRLLRGLGARECYERSLAQFHVGSPPSDYVPPKRHPGSVIEVLVKHLKIIEHLEVEKRKKMDLVVLQGNDPGWTVTSTFVEWLRTIVLHRWDGKPLVNKWSSAGTAMRLLDTLHAEADALNLPADIFSMSYFADKLSSDEAPLDYLTWKETPNIMHLLQLPSLFHPDQIVAYFRTINFTSMMKQYDHTTRIHQMRRSLDMFIRDPYWWVIKSRMRVTLSEALNLDISREKALEDTLNQLWGQEKRTLLKPLKVKMGQQEGEVGLDHGGVTYEFFRVVLREAFKPEYGMFTMDTKTRMTWFQPGTVEPKWKFEILGILFSLAVYNGITLPVTFPLALYHFLLPDHAPLRNHGVDCKSLDYINDGWPDLAKAMREFLAWDDGDVGDVIMREYAFSYEVFGQKKDIDMTSNASHKSRSSNKEIPLVTNANRKDFVVDYIRFLTRESIAEQLKAFRAGFYACISTKSLDWFSPSSLRDLVEGTQDVSMVALKEHVRYENDYSPSHKTIKMFWAVVETLSQEDCRRLLEFVTASDRIPVTGYQSITFHIVQVDVVPEHLPTSSTCFGKLYLPEYTDETTLREKLLLAIQNSQGFGIV